jgi:hypothetical protein
LRVRGVGFAQETTTHLEFDMTAPHLLDHRQTQSFLQIEASLRDLITAYGSGALEERRFVDEILHLEAEKMNPRGFLLTASTTDDDWTMVALHVKGRSEPCAVFEFLPGRAEIRRSGS